MKLKKENVTQTASDAAALQRAEQSAQAAVPSGGSADAQVDAAINRVLAQRGYRYNTATDSNYQSYLQERRANAAAGRAVGENTAQTLAGGYAPSYASAVGSEIAGAYRADAGDAAASYRSMALADNAAQQAQKMNSASLYSDIANRNYSRSADAAADKRSYMQYLSEKYGRDLQTDAQLAGIAAQIDTQKLAADAENRNLDRTQAVQRYLNSTLSADAREKLRLSEQQSVQSDAYNRAALAANERADARKLNYQKQLDAYNQRVAQEKADAKAAAAAEKADAKAEAAAEKAQQQANKAAQQAEKTRQTQLKYAKRNVGKIKKYLAGKIKLGVNDQIDLDFNDDGKVDTADLLTAQKQYQALQDAGGDTQGKAAGEGSGAKTMIVPSMSKPALKVIEKIDKDLGTRKRDENLAEYIRRLSYANKLKDEETAFLYDYYGYLQGGKLWR